MFQQTQFEQHPGFRRIAVCGQVVEKRLEQTVGFRMARVFADQLLDQLATVTGQRHRLEVVAQPGAQIDQVNFAQREQLPRLRRRPVNAHLGEQLQSRPVPFPAFAGTAGKALAATVIGSKKCHDPVRFAVVDVTENDRL